MQSNLTCTWFEVAANKNHTIFSGRVRDTGKLKKQGNFLLLRRRKECATEFKTLADYVIPRNNLEISLVAFMPNITTNHAITYTNTSWKAGPISEPIRWTLNNGFLLNAFKSLFTGIFRVTAFRSLRLAMHSKRSYKSRGHPRGTLVFSKLQELPCYSFENSVRCDWKFSTKN